MISVKRCTVYLAFLERLSNVSVLTTVKGKAVKMFRYGELFKTESFEFLNMKSAFSLS